MPTPCPGCNKLASLEMEDPELTDIDVGEDGVVTASVHITRSSVCCSEPMKSADLDLEYTPDAENAAILAKHAGEGHSLSVEEAGVEPTEHSEGKGRGTRSFFGAEVEFNVSCSCSEEELFSATMSDRIQASHMDDDA